MKRLISTCLVLCMVLSMLPVGAFAVDDTSSTATTNGSQGLDYVLSDDGNSYIVSGIGSCADADLVIPATYEGLPVTAIADLAFDNCNQLTSVTLPDSIRTLGRYAFNYCQNMVSVNIPTGITTLTWGVFQGCRALATLTSPASVTNIERYAINDCSGLTQIVVDQDNEHYCSVDGVLFAEDMSTLICYPGGREGASYAVPSGVKKIGHSAFAWSKNLISVYNRQ